MLQEQTGGSPTGKGKGGKKKKGKGAAAAGGGVAPHRTAKGRWGSMRDAARARRDDAGALGGASYRWARASGLTADVAEQYDAEARSSNDSR